ncbi:unnamed protein product [Onchocerca flexuosa]|uniref:Uncharacterized protein n=1 Tax=Onchocerca flexuosa TaxID=387005 RepID=A0A183HDK1_9BILA|nr:unnamed protein product [Onchocerca flexuosa]
MTESMVLPQTSDLFNAFPKNIFTFHEFVLTTSRVRPILKFTRRKGRALFLRGYEPFILRKTTKYVGTLIGDGQTNRPDKGKMERKMSIPGEGRGQNPFNSCPLFQFSWHYPCATSTLNGGHGHGHGHLPFTLE